MKIRAVSLGLLVVSALSACAVVPYSPTYGDYYRPYPEYPPYGYTTYPGYRAPYIYPVPVVAPPVIWGGWGGGRWYGHSHGGHHGGGGTWHR